MCLGSTPGGGTLFLVCNKPTRSTQPSTLRGTVKWVSALGLSNNKWRRWMQMVVGLVWGFVATSALSLHSSNEPGELSQLLCHDDSTINIISVIIIIIIIVINDLPVWQVGWQGSAWQCCPCSAQTNQQQMTIHHHILTWGPLTFVTHQLQFSTKNGN